LKGNRIEVTPLGETVVQILEAYCPKIISETLTRETEQNMNLVHQRKLKKEEVIQQAQQVLTEILTVFKTRENEIGERLAASFTRAQQARSLLGKCPKCGNHLRIIYSKKTHLRFAGCEGYFKGICDFSSPLPQKNIIQPTQTLCKYCDYPIVKVYRKERRRPWLLCINTECPNKQSAIR
jgi:DNA topoisomerase-1